MPAAAVIPAPIAYIKVVAVKKLVVGFLARGGRPVLNRTRCWLAPAILLENAFCPSLGGGAIQIVYFEKIRVFKAGNRCEYISME